MIVSEAKNALFRMFSPRNCASIELPTVYTIIPEINPELSEPRERRDHSGTLLPTTTYISILRLKLQSLFLLCGFCYVNGNDYHIAVIIYHVQLPSPTQTSQIHIYRQFCVRGCGQAVWTTRTSCCEAGSIIFRGSHHLGINSGYEGLI